MLQALDELRPVSQERPLPEGQLVCTTPPFYNNIPQRALSGRQNLRALFDFDCIAGVSKATNM